ncbi:MAG: pectin acetylesterase-family hydrolase [Anaerolineae bacterium]
MRKFRLIAALMLLLFTGSAMAQDVPTRAQLPAGWNQISPGGATICGHGAPYSFYYREGESNNLVIDFQGGGMCWDGQTCNISTTTFDDSVLANDSSDNPGLASIGIMNPGNGDNPFGSSDIVYVNYCTGDMHTGDRTVGYSYNDTYFEVNHRGRVNAEAVLNWVYNNIPTPDSVFVTGCSAGAVGAAYWSADIMRHYPGQRVTLFGDSGAWRGIADKFTQWGATYNGSSNNLSIPQFYLGAARAFPNNIVAMYNTFYDETQNFFNYIGFSSVPYADGLAANLRDLVNGASNFRYYTQGGSLHCILPRDEFYLYAADYVRLIDWLNDIMQGQHVPNVDCAADDCTNPGIYNHSFP